MRKRDLDIGLERKYPTYTWTTQKVLEFARISTLGPYGDYKGCKSLEAKLNRFIELNEEKEFDEEHHSSVYHGVDNKQ